MVAAKDLLSFLAIAQLALINPYLYFPMLILFIALWFTSYWYLSFLYLIWYLYDRKTPFRGGRRISVFRKSSIWKYAAQHFPMKLHKTAELDPSKNYLFGFHPHGLYSSGAVLNFPANGTGFDELFPGIEAHLLTLNGMFSFPIYRDYLIALGHGAVSSDSIDYKLSKCGTGKAVVIVVGGTAEMLCTVNSNAYELKLKDRKGFIRRALKNGASLVPVFSFNEHRIHDVLQPKEGSFPHFLQRFVKTILGFDFPVLIYGFSGYLTTIPKKISVNTVVGAPIDLNKMKNFDKGQDPPEDTVDECHAIYLNALRKLYDDHKAKFGDENTPLIFS